MIKQKTVLKSVPSFETKLTRYILFAAVLPSILLMFTLWQYETSVYISLLILILISSVIGYCTYRIRHKMAYQFRSLSNLLTGLSEGDYSMRGINHHGNDALGELTSQINNLTSTLAEQRFIAHESQLLVAKIIQHIDVAIIAIDQNQHIALLNPQAEDLLNATQQQALGQPLSNFNASELLAIKQPQLIKLSFAPLNGDYQVIHDHYREQGQQHDLYFITNVHGLLREHERQAWQNLIRVLSHEINNSLAPIASLADTLKNQATKQALDDIYPENLDIIAQRANSLKHFIGSYRQLSFLPEPKLQSTNLNKILQKLPPLFSERTIEITCPSNLLVLLDVAQIEQVLINIIKNADEAMQTLEANMGDQINDNKSDNQADHLSETVSEYKQKINAHRSIKIAAYSEQKSVTLKIIDQGMGIKNNDNLFTPFYSTKKQGSGIGLLLSRQIIEAHGGFITIANRTDTQGCIVEIQLPHTNCSLALK